MSLAVLEMCSLNPHMTSNITLVLVWYNMCSNKYLFALSWESKYKYRYCSRFRAQPSYKCLISICHNFGIHFSSCLFSHVGQIPWISWSSIQSVTSCFTLGSCFTSMVIPTLSTSWETLVSWYELLEVWLGFFWSPLALKKLLLHEQQWFKPNRSTASIQ